MSTFWESVKRKTSAAGKVIKESTVSAGQATGRAAKRTKIKADIALLERKVRLAKEEFGTKVWKAMDAADQAGVDAIFGDYKLKIDGLNAQIAGKRDDLEALNADAAGAPRPDSTSYPAAATSATASTI